MITEIIVHEHVAVYVIFVELFQLLQSQADFGLSEFQKFARSPERTI